LATLPQQYSAAISSGNFDEANRLKAIAQSTGTNLAQVSYSSGGGSYSSAPVSRPATTAAPAAYDAAAAAREAQALLEAQQRARQEAINGRVNEAVTQMSGNYGKIDQYAEDAARQAYIQREINGRDMPQLMAAMGQTGGASETAAMGLLTGYENSMNGIQRTRNDARANLDTEISGIRAAGEAQKSDLEGAYLDKAYQDYVAREQMMLDQARYEADWARDAERYQLEWDYRARQEAEARQAQERAAQLQWEQFYYGQEKDAYNREWAISQDQYQREQDAAELAYKYAALNKASSGGGGGGSYTGDEWKFNQNVLDSLKYAGGETDPLYRYREQLPAEYANYGAFFPSQSQYMAGQEAQYGNTAGYGQWSNATPNLAYGGAAVQQYVSGDSAIARLQALYPYASAEEIRRMLGG
jgi:hypothetical protein